MPLGKSVRRRSGEPNSKAMLALLRRGKRCPSLSPDDRHAAHQVVQRILSDIPEGRNGRPAGITNNPAAVGFSLAEKFVQREVLPNCPQLDPVKETVGRGHVGYVGAVEAFARMIRDAEPLPGTSPEIVEARRKLFGSDEQLRVIRESKRRVRRRKNSKRGASGK